MSDGPVDKLSGHPCHGHVVVKAGQAEHGGCRLLRPGQQADAQAKQDIGKIGGPDSSGPVACEFD